MMQIEIHDVGHGACSVVTLPDNTRIMVDCGCDPNRQWWPSIHYFGQFIDALVIQNLDEDHVEDLPDLWRNVSLGSIYTNPSVSSYALAAMKLEGGMNSGVRKAHDILKTFQPGAIGRLPLAKGGGARAWAFSNSYGLEFHDTNNLSVVIFVEYAGFLMLFAGDLEKDGWLGLMRSPQFRAALPYVKVLVASHHGRESGCSTEAFHLMRPEIVIFSDDKKQYETQEMDGWYRCRVTGIPDLTRPHALGSSSYPRRHVLTTRRDGTISLMVRPDGTYLASGSNEAQPGIGALFAPTLGLGQGIDRALSWPTLTTGVVPEPIGIGLYQSPFTRR